ncbi:ATP-dependent nuclease [Pseudoalteromonas sp. B160]|uniref:ATP-dependent nuclease n=1 Tax=Pseudoalteromonas sp. B160 TaxID=630414 RepID=UPI00301DC14F
MNIESLWVKNFRSFGSDGQHLSIEPDLTALVGANGAGKTALMQALQRMFGISNEQRMIRRQDFHIPASEKVSPSKRALILEAIVAFPELDNEEGDHSAIPDFFHNMSVTDDEGKLKCRLRLDAEWEDDGSIDGYITSNFCAVTTLGKPEEADFRNVRPVDRSRIQLIYIPATRSASSQVSAFLKGRLWKAINWSEQVRSSFTKKATELNEAFEKEKAISTVTRKLTERWQELHSAGTDSTPKFRPVDLRFEEFVRKVEVLLHPDESGRDRSIDELSDGQSSLFHIAMTSATLDVENEILVQPKREDFLGTDLPLPSLTILALEEPENNLAPYYLSRIVSQLDSLASGLRAQTVLSSHSPSILARIQPKHVRHFRIKTESNSTVVRQLTLPNDENEAAKYIQQAVKAFPELYFAKVVVLGEGASEEVILPAISESMGVTIDKSFVAMVPLGGRHVNHMWRLLTDLNIPYITLLDLDWGRHGGGWGRIKNTVTKLIEYGVPAERIFTAGVHANGVCENLAEFDSFRCDDYEFMSKWVSYLRAPCFNVYFSSPLDIDYSMLKAFPQQYKVAPDENSTGPSNSSMPGNAVLGDEGNSAFYAHDLLDLRWYRYLFLGRGKPSTHIRVLGTIASEQLAQNAPEELRALVQSIHSAIQS